MKKLFFMCLAIILLLSSNFVAKGQEPNNLASSKTKTQSSDSLRFERLKSSTVGRLVFKTDTTKTKRLRCFNDPVKDIIEMINLGERDFVILTTYDDGGAMFIRVLILDDDRMIRISNEMQNRFYFTSEYLDKTKQDPKKLIECFINKDGKVIQLSTVYKIDPDGKDEYVSKDEIVKANKKWGVQEVIGKEGELSYGLDEKTLDIKITGGKTPISDKDPTVVRYQNEIDVLLKLF